MLLHQNVTRSCVRLRRTFRSTPTWDASSRDWGISPPGVLLLTPQCAKLDTSWESTLFCLDLVIGTCVAHGYVRVDVSLCLVSRQVCGRSRWIPLDSEQAIEDMDVYASEPEVHQYLHQRRVLPRLLQSQ